MTAVTSLGVGSGLDLQGMLTKLMAVEQQPITALQTKQASYQSRISALGTLASSLTALQTAAAALTPATGQTAAEKFVAYSASVSDATIASATAAKGAVAGSYSLEIANLAVAQRLVSPASSFTSNTTAIDASGTLKIEFGKFTAATTTPAAAATYTPDSARDLSITVAAGSSLADISNAINAANGDVTSTIVTGTNGPQLVLTSKQSGSDNVMRLSGLTGTDAGNFNFDPEIASPSTLSETAAGGQVAVNANFTLNGIAATSSTNTVTGALDGVTLNLTKTNVGSPTTVTVSQNTTSSLTTALQAFVKAYNDANSSMGSLGTYNSSTKFSGPLQGDASLRTAQTQVRALLFNTSAGGSSPYQRLSDIGVSVAKDGSLSLDTSKLNKAVTADYASVSALVGKVGAAYNTTLEGIAGKQGSLVASTDSTTRMIKALTDRQATLTARLTQIEANYRKQFTALDSMVSSMNSTSTYLTQQLANLPGFTNKA